MILILDLLLYPQMTTLCVDDDDGQKGNLCIGWNSGGEDVGGSILVYRYIIPLLIL